MLSLEQIKSKLEDRNLRVVAEKTGICYQTLWRLKSGEVSSPRLDTIEKLTRYFKLN
jgi:DNA-binding Xre family transcriptional regulator